MMATVLEASVTHPESVPPSVSAMKEEIYKLWQMTRRRMDKVLLPGLVYDITAECEHIQLWQVNTILPILANHVKVLDRRIESEKRDILKKKVEEEQHYFWQIARGKKARPPPLLKKDNAIISDPWDILENINIFWGSIYNSPAVFDESEFRHRFRVSIQIL